MEDDAGLEAEAKTIAQEIASVERALARMRDGSYGICVRCGEKIGDERLLAAAGQQAHGLSRAGVERQVGNDETAAAGVGQAPHERLGTAGQDIRRGDFSYDAANDELTLYVTSQNPHVHRLIMGAFVLGVAREPKGRARLGALVQRRRW